MGTTMVLAVMAFAGLRFARAFRLDVPAGRTVAFNGATRNSSVVPPLALAPLEALAVAAVVVVTQILVEWSAQRFVSVQCRWLPTSGRQWTASGLGGRRQARADGRSETRRASTGKPSYSTRPYSSCNRCSRDAVVTTR